MRPLPLEEGDRIRILRFQNAGSARQVDPAASMADFERWAEELASFESLIACCAVVPTSQQQS
jgi:hypothetical protein